MNASRRLFSYSLAFAGLMVVLYAVTGLLVLIISTITLRDATLIGAEDARSRASFYLAALIVGTPLWLSFWLAAQRRAGAPEEQGASERRLFLGAVFAITALTALFALQTLLRILFTFPGAAQDPASPLEGIAAAVRLVIYGAAWAFHARLGWRERRPADPDEWHDLAIYIVSAVALGMLAIGLGEALSRLLTDLLAVRQPVVLAEPAGSVWTIWGPIAARIIAAGPVWAAAWQYDLLRGGRRDLRIAYLYLVLAAAVPAALAGGTSLLSELLRRLFGYRALEEGWTFVRDALPPLLIGAGLWAYHWQAMRRQAALAGLPQPQHPNTIIWPRRGGISLLVLVGLAMAAPALVSIIWLGLDLLLNTARTLSGPGWWRDQLSFSIAAGVIGGAAWITSWRVLQRAAEADPAVERASDGRRRLLATIVLATALAAIGFTIAVLWMILQALLGVRLESSDISSMLKFLSAAAVALGLLAYHGLLLRRDRALAGPRARQLRVVALVAPGAEEVLAALSQRTGRRILVAGRLAPDGAQPQMDLPALEQLLARIDTAHEGESDSVLLLLRHDGGSLHPYARQQHSIS